MNPISLDTIMNLVAEGETEMEQDTLTLWNAIKMTPEKWSQVSYPDKRIEFWVVGLIGKTAIYYNDIEEGFNISGFKTYGHLDDWGYEQDELPWAMIKLFRSRNLQ
ncbi:MAG TPA: hypothetical protein VIU12_20185 [Chryseolinea sp.]